MPILVGGTSLFGAAPADGVGTPGAPLHDGQLVLGDLTLGQTDENGVEWILEKLTGWSSSTGSTGSSEQRVGRHGGLPTPAVRTPRVVEIEGSLLASSWDAAERALDRLWSALPLDALGMLYVAQRSRILQAAVRQEGVPLIVDEADGWRRFSLSLSAPDVRRYSAYLSSNTTGLPSSVGGLSLPITLPLTIGATVVSGVLTLVNEGNISTPWTATYTGPPGTTITHVQSGRSLRIKDEVPAGRALVIDSDRGMAVLDGSSRVVTGSWFDLEPGSNDLALWSPYGGDATFTVSFRSAWR